MRRRTARTLIFALTMTVLVAGCGAQDAAVTTTEADDIDEVVDDDQQADSALTAFGCTVQTLLPQDSREVCGGRIVSQMFSGLAELDPVTGEPVPLVASSIETEDATTWTVKLVDGWTFHNGEPVTARSFVDAWNFTADPDNGMRNADFFADIVGYDELQSGQSEELSGLELIDEMTIEITLQEPFAPFLAKLTDSAFYPLPSIAYEDIAAYGRQPVGNGRYELMSFDPDREAVLQRYEAWAGPNPGETKEIVFIIYTGDAALQTAYLDVQAGALDVLEDVPAENLTTVDDDFGDRVVRTPTSSFTFLGLPMYDENFGDNAPLRQALSLAIDRQAIIESIFDGGLEPATALIPPVLESHRADACDTCTFDPDRAVALFEEAGGWEGPMTVYFNSGSGHEEWVEAITNQWRQVLGIDTFVYQSMEFAPYLQTLEEFEATGPFRLGWSLAYLSPEYALSDVYRSSGGANFFGYDNEEFDEALEFANAADPGDADELYQVAEDIVLDDLPVIPLWYGVSTTVHTDRVRNVTVDATTYLRVERIRVVD